MSAVTGITEVAGVSSWMTNKDIPFWRMFNISDKPVRSCPLFLTL